MYPKKSPDTTNKSLITNTRKMMKVMVQTTLDRYWPRTKNSRTHGREYREQEQRDEPPSP